LHGRKRVFRKDVAYLVFFIFVKIQSTFL
jgi:hypothetical protein